LIDVVEFTPLALCAGGTRFENYIEVSAFGSEVLEIAKAIPLLVAAPKVFRTMLEGLDDVWIHGDYGPATFIPFDVISYLILGERVDWMPRIRNILEHGEDRPFDPFDRYAMYEGSKGKTIHELLATFGTLWADNIEDLRSLALSPVDLLKKGTHPEFG
jgi:hypothetical protein